MAPALSLTAAAMLLPWFCALTPQRSAAQQIEHIAVFLNANPSWPDPDAQELATIREGHLGNFRRLFEEGKLAIAGPFADGSGLVVLRTTSLDAASDMFRPDPAIRAGAFHVEMLRVAFVKGGVCAPPDDASRSLHFAARYLVGDPDEDSLHLDERVLVAGRFENRREAFVIFDMEYSEERLALVEELVGSDGRTAVFVKGIAVARDALCPREGDRSRRDRLKEASGKAWTDADAL